LATDQKKAIPLSPSSPSYLMHTFQQAPAYNGKSLAHDWKLS